MTMFFVCVLGLVLESFRGWNESPLATGCLAPKRSKEAREVTKRGEVNYCTTYSTRRSPCNCNLQQLDSAKLVMSGRAHVYLEPYVRIP